MIVQLQDTMNDIDVDEFEDNRGDFFLKHLCLVWHCMLCGSELADAHFESKSSTPKTSHPHGLMSRRMSYRREEHIDTSDGVQ